MNLLPSRRIRMLLLFCAVLHCPPVVFPADTGSPDSSAARAGQFRIRASAGYANCALSDAEKFFSDALKVYQEVNIPIQAQQAYPGNLIVGLDLCFDVSDVLEAGVGGEYTWTRASARYGDYSGMLDLTSNARLLNLQAFTRLAFVVDGDLRLFLEPRLGLGICWFDVKEEIHITYIVDEKFSSTIEASGTRFTGDIYGGLEYEVGAFEFFIKAGYRYAVFSELDGEISQTGGMQQGGTLDFDVDMSGATFLAGVALRL